MNLITKEKYIHRRTPGEIRFKTDFKNVIYQVLVARGWKQTEGDDWDFIWV